MKFFCSIIYQEIKIGKLFFLLLKNKLQITIYVLCNKHYLKQKQTKEQKANFGIFVIDIIDYYFLIIALSLWFFESYILLCLQ